MKNLRNPDKINPLDYFEVRKFKVPPGYFEYICVPLTYNLEKSIEKWIDQNLRGRFYVGRSLDVESNSLVLKIGFEEAKELSLFTLACPHLKYN